MSKQNDNLQELFALPINVQEVASIDGVPLYSNDKLKKKYLNSLSKNNGTKAVINDFERLVNDGAIVPCWLNKGLKSLIFYKIFAPLSVKGICGFYHPEINQFFILIDNNITLGFASDTILSRITLHESMHMFAHKNPKGFLNIFEKDLEKWYFHFFIQIFDLNVDKLPKDFNTFKLVEFIFNNVEKKMNVSGSVFSKYEKMVKELCHPYTRLSDRDFEFVLKDLVTLPLIYYNSMDSFIQLINRYRHIIGSMYEAYNHAFGIKSLSTLCIQELLYPSEIICILAESNPTSRVHRAIKTL